MFATVYKSQICTGNFNIPVSCLLSSSKERLVREPDSVFVARLKHEMLENKTCDVAPLVATVRLLDDEQFDTKHPEAYTCIRDDWWQPLKNCFGQLLKEKKELALDPKFFNRRVEGSVFTLGYLTNKPNI